MNILITSCSKKVLLIKSFKTHLNNMGGLLFATDISINSPALYFADDYFLCPRFDEPLFIDFMIKNCIKHKIKLIIPTSCRELRLFSEHKKEFEENGCKVMISSVETIDICQNKDLFIKFCINNDIPIPCTYANFDEITNYPVFSKPITGSASQGLKIINNKDELQNIDFKNNVVQEFIDWKEYTIDYLSDFDGKYINCIPRERIHVVNGESCVSQVFNNEIIKDHCKIIGNKLQ